jgi:hypothetical protein
MFNLYFSNDDNIGGKTSLAIILLATLMLTLIVPAISGISSIQQAKAQAISGRNGSNGNPNCQGSADCFANGGKGGTENSYNMAANNRPKNYKTYYYTP